MLALVKLETVKGAARAAQQLPPDAGSELIARDHFAQDASGRLYRYVEGVYRPDAEDFVRQQACEMFAEAWTRYKGAELVEYIRLNSPVLWRHPRIDEMNVRNGILNVETRTLRTHDPNFLSSVQLPVVFNPATKCPAWEQQIAETFPEDATLAGVAWEIVAWLMTADTALQKALLLIGEGGTGKSTFLRALIAFLGEEHVSAVSLQKLETERFAPAQLMGKLANICADLPSTHLETSSTFKAITGGDLIPAERKYGHPFKFTPYARLVFSANQLPRSADATEAFFDRWVLLPFDRKFRDTRSEINQRLLSERLSDPEELSGVLNKALAALPRVRKLGLTVTPSTRTAVKEFQSVTDPLAAWLERSTIEDPTAQISKAELLRAYNEDALQHGRGPTTDKSFGTALRRLRPKIKDAQRTIRSKARTHCWLGIDLEEHREDASR
jgi:P4 family phage/plasmid primase-like protien